jgi:diacylglycerol kinase family enzyme
MRILVLTNPHSGPQGSNEQLARDAFRECSGHDVIVRALPPTQIFDAAKSAIEERFDCIVAGGGDGTINCVASALVGSDVALGVMPLGTLNHFAKDLRIPIDPTEAARVICSGKSRRVDVAEVNGRVFVNNSSIGIYPSIVKRRDGQIDRLGRGKFISTILAAISALRRFPTVEVRLNVNGDEWHCTTPFVMIGNNPYSWDLFNFASRERIDGGELGVYFAHRTGRFGLLKLILRGWFRRLDQARDFGSLTTRELWIQTRKHELRVATDGEIRKMTTPLHYIIRPGALRVMAP